MRRKFTLMTALVAMAAMFLSSSLLRSSAASPQPSTSQATVTTDKTDYQPGETVVIVGSGWAAGETVKLTLHESRASEDTSLTAVADEYGNILNKEFSTTQANLGSTFDLTATGETSGRTASAKFTDGGTMNYSPNSISLTAYSGTSGSSTTGFAQAVTAPGGNNSFTANAQVVSVSVGGGIAMPASWVTVSPNGGNFSTGPANNPKPDSKIRNVSITPATNTAPGLYTVVITSTPSNNTVNAGQGTTVMLTVTADNAPPTTTLSAVDSNSNIHDGINFTNANKVTVTLTATDAGGSGIKKTRYKIDNAPFQDYNSPFDIAAQGLSVITYFSIDNTGATETSKFFTVRIDKTAPVITLNGAAEMTIPYGSTFTDPGATATDSGGSGLASAVIVSGSVDTLTVGDYTLSYNVSDNAGNAAATVTRLVHVVKADQTIIFGALADKTYGDPDFNVSATAGSGLPVSFSAGGNCTVTGNNVHITGAGNCTITASQAGNQNYNAATPVQQSFTINKAAAVINVSGFTGDYDAQPHGATGSATGAKGEDLSALLNLGGTFTDAPGGTANWSFAGDANHNPANGSVNIVINPINASIVVNGYTGVYDGDAHGATGTATGLNGVDLSSLLNLGQTFTDVPGGTANWSFSGNNNYNPANGTAEIVISKADATVNVNGYSGVYDGQSHGATGSATGVKGEDLSSLLNLGASFTDVPGGTANWSFAGNNNYNPANGSVNIEIAKANANIVVNGYTGTYDGQSHGATGSASGVQSEDLSSLLNLGSSFVNVPGGTANWSFAGNNNYNSAQGTASIVINPKPLTITASSPADITYGDVAPSVTPGYNGFISGENASNLTTQPTCGTSYTQGSNAGNYPTTCAGAAAQNYSISYVAGSLNVLKKQLTVTADNKSKIYDGLPYSPFTVQYSGFVLGQNQAVLGGTLTFSGTAVGAINVGTYTITPGGLASNNYSFNYVNGTLTIQAWTLHGFYQPVDMSTTTTVWNTVKAGSTVPLKFNIYAGTVEKTNTASVKSFTAGVIPCTGGLEDPDPLTTTGGTSLRYDTTGGQFVQNWQTPKQPGTCYAAAMTAQDGSTIRAFFKLK